MPLEVRQGDEDVGIHDGAADFGFLYISAAFHRDQGLIGAFQTVGNDHMAAGGEGRKAVGVGCVHVVQGIFASADIQGVAVGQERFAAQFFDDLDHHGGVVGPQVSQVAGFTKMDLDGGKFVVEINLPDAGGFDQPFQLLGQVLIERGTQVGKIYFRCRHSHASCWGCFALLSL